MLSCMLLRWQGMLAVTQVCTGAVILCVWSGHACSIPELCTGCAIHVRHCLMLHTTTWQHLARGCSKWWRHLLSCCNLHVRLLRHACAARYAIVPLLLRLLWVSTKPRKLARRQELLLMLVRLLMESLLLALLLPNC